MDNTLSFQVKGSIDTIPNSIELPVKEVIDYAFSEMIKHFEEDRGPKGSWPNLKPATWEKKTTTKMLFETGEYLRSWRKEIEQTKGSIYTENMKGIWHETGTVFMPARPYIWLAEDNFETIAKMIEKAISKTLDDTKEEKI